MSYCNVTLVGNAGNDPTLKFTPSGMAVCDFSLAVNRKWTDKVTNEKKEEVTWFKVTFWGQKAEVVAQYVKKGSQVLVVGDRLKADTYVAKDGSTRVSLELTANEVRFLGGNGNTVTSETPQTAEEELFGAPSTPKRPIVEDF